MCLKLALIGLGGFFGAISRYSAGLMCEYALGSSFLWATLLVNILGSLLIGFFGFLALEKVPIMLPYKEFIIVGFIGSFTTFSTISLELLQLFQTGLWIKAGIYTFATLSLGLLAVFSGWGLSQFFFSSSH